MRDLALLSDCAGARRRRVGNNHWFALDRPAQVQYRAVVSYLTQ
jgi:hypothetical protein